MHRALFALLILLLPTAAAAEDWSYEALGVPIAYVDNGAAQLQFACRGGDLALGFWVRVPHRQVAAATTMSLAITPDPAAGGSLPAGTSFAQELPLIHADGSSIVVRGPVARQWALLAQRARAAIQLAYVQSGAQGGLEVFDSNSFGAEGSAAAIGKVLDRCG